MFDLEWNISNIKGQGEAHIEIIVRDWLDDIAHFAEMSFERHVPFKTGRMAAAVREGVVNKHPWGWSVSIGIDPVDEVDPGESPNYPKFVEEGTGIFGNNHDVIKPQHGNVMVFSVTKKKFPGFTKNPNARELAEGVIFTRHVQGQPAQHYLEDTYQEVKAVIRLRKRELARRISRAIRESN